jgi:hypothetical protein
LVNDTSERLDPVWEPIQGESPWLGFQARFHFRPGTEPSTWPAIREPEPSLTIDLAPIFENEGRGAADVNGQVLAAMTEAFPDDTRLLALDWFHVGYRFRPHRFAATGQQWRITPFPNGDYHIFATADMTAGTFGHPWERTLCLFGAPLLNALAPRLTAWLPVKRDNRR